ncbi:uncharacterized protein LOC127508880 isoform X2 [Ctenopharyngodon idella]|uniref:uncharacterized protein LOC127508880 isoform X2 n=1 Tax=Ctenopharyngodon idella TaxID=7959 RepID=UPI002231D80D|nr:uncharacterized protein LOC127508880 isoform X2 [Ctenopharyngodon idella]
MASEGSFHSRIYFLCPHCKKAPRSLPGHLRTACMRDRAEAEVRATVIEAKKEMSEFTHRGRFWEYQRIQDILETADPLARLLDEMQKKGLVVTNKPLVLPNPTLPVPSLPSSAPQSPGEGANEPHVVTNVTVQEWEGKTHIPNGASVAVKEDKTEVLLTDDQEHGFGLYSNKVRPATFQGNDAKAEDKFFVLSSGRPIYNPCNDSNRLNAKHNLPSVTTRSREKRMNEQTAFDLLVQSYPVTLDGSPPKRARRHEHERHCYNRWCSEQLKLREQRVLGEDPNTPSVTVIYVMSGRHK